MRALESSSQGMLTWRLPLSTSTTSLRLALDLGGRVAAGEAMVIEKALAFELAEVSREAEARVSVAAGWRYLTISAHCPPQKAGSALEGIAKVLASVCWGEGAYAEQEREQSVVRGDPVEMLKATLSYLSGDWSLSPWAAATGMGAPATCLGPEEAMRRLREGPQLLICAGPDCEAFLPFRPAPPATPALWPAAEDKLATLAMPLGKSVLCGVVCDAGAIENLSHRRVAARAIAWLLHQQLREKLQVTYGVVPLVGERSIAAFCSLDKQRVSEALNGTEEALAEIGSVTGGQRLAAGEELARLLCSLQTSEGAAEELLARAALGAGALDLDIETQTLHSLSEASLPGLGPWRLALVGSLPKSVRGSPVPEPWLR